jgi:HD superfamily phosphohydrolase YqeK
MFADHSAEIAESLTELDLNPEHLDIISYRNYSANAPYHNKHHCFSVALNALEGAKFYDLGVEEQRIVFLAGLYHDFEHSEGKKDDTVNIANAIKGMEYWCGRLESLTPETTNLIKQAINSTIWPSHLLESERSLLDLILCDADLLQWTASDVQNYRDGLAEEKMSAVTLKDTIDFVITHGAKTRWGADRINTWLETYAIAR